jgi:hypothetical protein
VDPKPRTEGNDSKGISRVVGGHTIRKSALDVLLSENGWLQKGVKPSRENGHIAPRTEFMNLIDGLQDDGTETITSWIQGQRDKGKAGIIVDAFGGRCYIVPNGRPFIGAGMTGMKDPSNLVSLSFQTPDDLETLRPFFDCVLVVGMLRRAWYSWFANTLKLDNAPHFLVHVVAEDLEKLKEMDIARPVFTGTSVRKLTVERGYKGGWAIGDELVVGLSTLHLGDREFPHPLQEDTTHLLRNMREEIAARKLAGEIPVYQGQSVPRVTFDRKCEAHTLLMYNLLKISGSEAIQQQ